MAATHILVAVDLVSPGKKNGTSEGRNLMPAGPFAVPMKILLRNQQTKHFLNEQGAWVKNPEEACAFQDCFAATRAAETCQTKKIEIVLKLKNGADVVLPGIF